MVFVVSVVVNEECEDRLYVFRDRFDAGRRVGVWLRSLGVGVDVVFAIPAGGVPVAFEIAKVLRARLDVLVCRKLLIPWNREAGFGAMAPNGTYFYDERLALYLGLSSRDIEDAIEEQRIEIRRRIDVYRCSEPYRPLNGLRIAVVDDGIAGGYTMIAATRFLKKLNPSFIAIVVPTCCRNTIGRVLLEKPDVLYCYNPRSGPIYAVADAYIEWRDLSDRDVIEILSKAKKLNLLNYSANCIP